MRNYDLNQKQITEILDVMLAAVCQCYQYFSNKRGYYELQDEEMLHEIDNSARRIFEGGTTQLVRETYRICRLLHIRKIFKELDYILRC